MRGTRVRSSLKGVCASVALLLLLGCAGPTPYQKRSKGEGYFDYEIMPGMYYLSFQANGRTQHSMVLTYWHRRAAEICGGEDRYEILGLDASGQRVVVDAPSLLNPYTLPMVDGRIRCKEE